MEDTPATAAAPAATANEAVQQAEAPAAPPPHAAPEPPTVSPTPHYSLAPAAPPPHAAPEPPTPHYSLAERVIIALRSEWHKLTEEEQEMVAAVKSWAKAHL